MGESIAVKNGGCGHAFPNCDASVMVSGADTGTASGTGALKRSFPSGGVAYGMPNHLSVPFSARTPRNDPVLSLTISGSRSAAAAACSAMTGAGSVLIASSAAHWQKTDRSACILHIWAKECPLDRSTVIANIMKYIRWRVVSPHACSLCS